MSDEIINTTNEDYKKDLAHYRNTLSFLGANVPIEALCLPVTIQNVLINQGILRAYDLIGHDLAKIKGIGVNRAALLASRLDEFFSVQL